MSLVSLLIELHNTDLQSDKNATTRADLERQLADTATLDSARAELNHSDTTVSALHTRLRALELEIAGLTEKLKQVNERLYSGRISNAKELAGLNDDEKMLQRRKSELEDQELVLMEQSEKIEMDTRAKRTRFEKISIDTTAQHAIAHAALHKLDTSDADLARKRESIRAQLDATTLNAYDTLRATKKGRAVSHLKNNSCGICGYAVPGGMISRVKAGNELVFCANCERILAP